MDFQQHLKCFKKLLDNFHIAELLKKDRCGALCDKYHLVIVFQFFMRAEFKEEDYTPRNFFLALTLSHDIYDESKVLKYIILTYYLGRNDGFKDKTKTTFHWDKLILYKRMQFKGFVQRKICKKLCLLISHRAFDRIRRELHTGYINNKILCDKCRCPMNRNFNKNRQENYSTNDKKSSDKTPRNNEQVSIKINEQIAKKRKKSDKNMFFRDFVPELFALEKKPVTFAC